MKVEGEKKELKQLLLFSLKGVLIKKSYLDFYNRVEMLCERQENYFYLAIFCPFFITQWLNLYIEICRNIIDSWNIKIIYKVNDDNDIFF